MPSGVLESILLLMAVVALARPLGLYMARVFQGQRTFLSGLLGPVERLVYRLSGIDPTEEMTWQTYAKALIGFSLVGVAALYALLRLQHLLPLNPQRFPSVGPYVAFNTAVSFVANTNWQVYGGETTMSFFSQMIGLATQNYLSAASGIAVVVAFIRALTRRESKTIGNFWVDLTRTTTYVLLPACLVLALVLVSQGVPQTFRASVQAHVLDPAAAPAGGSKAAGGGAGAEQVIALGPVASQEAIKEFGTNGGGFYNANSAHPFENPTPFSNWLEILTLLLIPFALPFTFGAMVGDRRQGNAILAAMLIIFVASAGFAIYFENRPNPLVAAATADAGGQPMSNQGNMEGKEVRFGPGISAMYATATTATSTGAVDSSHDSFTPLGGLIPMWLMQIGETSPGGVGSGLYAKLILVVIAVFVAGLMVGRTPEYLGKKIEPYEMKMAVLYLLIMPLTVLILSSSAVLIPAALAGISNPGPHGLSQILYAFSSGTNNNGSAFGGLGAGLPFYAVAVGVAILIGRFWMMIPVLAIAGSLAKKKIVPASSGTLPTYGPLFVGWLVAVTIIVAALAFFPALALGPIAEHLIMLAGGKF